MALKREEWALLAIAAADGAPLEPVQLQKALFLLGKEMPKAVGRDYYRFSPYNYGPFDQLVYADAEALAKRGLVTIDTPRRWAEYAATPEGIQAAKGLAAQVVDAWDYLRKVVAWARSLTFQQLVRAIYAAYPDQRVNSVFRD